MVSILSVVLAVLTGVSLLLAVGLVLFNLFAARKKGWIIAVARIGATILAAVVAVPIAQALAGTMSLTVFDLLLSLLGAELSDMITSVPVGAGGLQMIAAMFLSPLFYFFVFILLRLLLMVAGIIVSNVVPGLKKRKPAVTMPLGGLNGLLIAMVLLVPICGFLVTGAHVLDAAAGASLSEDITADTVLPDGALDTLLPSLGETDTTDGETAAETADEEGDALFDRSELSEIAEMIEKNPVVVVVYNTIGKPIFTWLTSGELELTEEGGESSTDTEVVTVVDTAAQTEDPSLLMLSLYAAPPSTETVTEAVTAGSDPVVVPDGVIEMNLENELCGLVSAAIQLGNVTESIQKDDYTEADKQHLYALADNFLGSEWRSYLATELFTAAADSWLNGASFAGVEKPAFNSAIEPTFNMVLQVFSEETPVTLSEDLHDLLDVVGDLLICDLLQGEIDPQDKILSLNEEKILQATKEKLSKNPRLAPIAGEVKALTVRLVSDMLGLDDLQSGKYASLMNGVAGELNDVLHLSKEERDPILSQSLMTQFKENGYDVPEDAALEMSDQIIDDLGGDGVITEQELTDYFSHHAATPAEDENTLSDGTVAP